MCNFFIKYSQIAPQCSLPIYIPIGNIWALYIDLSMVISVILSQVPSTMPKTWQEYKWCLMNELMNEWESGFVYHWDSSRYSSSTIFYKGVHWQTQDHTGSTQRSKVEHHYVHGKNSDKETIESQVRKM